MSPLLGCIADDFTGATDLAAMLAGEGMRVVQHIGPAFADTPGADALVVALKSRTAPVEAAVAESVAALDRLREAGCRQFYFKYCSTFDSTPEGNIGPVADALLDRLGGGQAVVCPAAPVNGRTVYQGHLFVGDRLLSESGMRDHPLTPMRDPDLVRVLSAQTSGRVGLVPFEAVRQGAQGVSAALNDLTARFAVVDALTDDDLRAIGTAVADHPLVTGAAGLAMGLPDNFRRAGLLSTHDADIPPAAAGRTVILAGSCSPATLAQLDVLRGHIPVFDLDLENGVDADHALAWTRAQQEGAPLAIAASAPPEKVRRLQERWGRAAAGTLVEDTLATLAEELVGSGVRRLVVAGGETSGAVVTRLGVSSLRIGPEIDPGVPWTWSERDGEPLLLALKSGNFGAPDFFVKALVPPGRG
ncbi:3-oxo-tetronate kinase [Streptosporangium sp. KLBMP 9127]|nr:four-carbon acid sugar kinase family protein [Streptosporangium sp. KLBMP 9127]